MIIHDSATASICKSFVQLQVIDRKHLAVLLQLHPYFSLLPFAECRKIHCGDRAALQPTWKHVVKTQELYAVVKNLIENNHSSMHGFHYQKLRKYQLQWSTASKMQISCKLFINNSMRYCCNCIRL
jgi:hypothetical protein